MDGGIDCSPVVAKQQNSRETEEAGDKEHWDERRSTATLPLGACVINVLYRALPYNEESTSEGEEEEGEGGAAEGQGGEGASPEEVMGMSYGARPGMTRKRGERRQEEEREGGERRWCHASLACFVCWTAMPFDLLPIVSLLPSPHTCKPEPPSMRPAAL